MVLAWSACTTVTIDLCMALTSTLKAGGERMLSSIQSMSRVTWKWVLTGSGGKLEDAHISAPSGTCLSKTTVDRQNSFTLYIVFEVALFWFLCSAFIGIPCSWSWADPHLPWQSLWPWCICQTTWDVSGFSWRRFGIQAAAGQDAGKNEGSAIGGGMIPVHTKTNNTNSWPEVKNLPSVTLVCLL